MDAPPEREPAAAPDRGREDGRGFPRERALVVAAVVTAVALRVAHVLFQRASPLFDAPVMDALYHVEWARAFAAGERFQEGPFFRAPLYPWFLGVLTWLSGVLGGGLLLPRLAQALLGGLSTWLTYRVGRRAFDGRVGVLAAWAVATYWVLVHFDGELLIPALLVPLDLAALDVTLGLAQGARRRRAAAAGALWGLSAIARPNVLLVLPFLALWLVLRRAGRGRGGLGLALALAGGTLLPVLPVTVLNRVAGGEWVLISTQAGVNFWIGNNPESDGSTAIVPGTRGGWWEGYYDAIALAEAEAGRALSPTEVSRHYARKAWGWMGAEPLDALRHQLWKLRLFWTNAELGNNVDPHFFAHRFDPLLRWLPLRFDVLAGLAALGLVLALRRADGTFPLWSFLLVYSASVVAFFVCSRYRVPVLPVLAVLASAGALRLVELARARRWRALGGSAALVLAALVLTDLRPAGKIRPSAVVGRLQLATAYLEAGRPEAAIALLEEVLDRAPGDLIARQVLAGAVLAQGDDPGRAERLAREGLRWAAAEEGRGGRRLPGTPELRAQLLGALLQAGDSEGARREADAFLAADARQPLVLFQRARARAALGDVDGAFGDLERAHTLDPRARHVVEAAIALLEQLGRGAEAGPWRARLGGATPTRD